MISCHSTADCYPDQSVQVRHKARISQAELQSLTDLVSGGVVRPGLSGAQPSWSSCNDCPGLRWPISFDCGAFAPAGKTALVAHVSWLSGILTDPAEGQPLQHWLSGWATRPVQSFRVFSQVVG